MYHQPWLVDRQVGRTLMWNHSESVTLFESFTNHERSKLTDYDRWKIQDYDHQTYMAAMRSKQSANSTEEKKTCRKCYPFCVSVQGMNGAALINDKLLTAYILQVKTYPTARQTKLLYMLNKGRNRDIQKVLPFLCVWLEELHWVIQESVSFVFFILDSLA